MEVELLAFGIAKDIFGSSSIRIGIEDKCSISALKKRLISAYPDFEKLASFSIAVNSEYQDDDFIISVQDEIAIIPPVSGG